MIVMVLLVGIFLNIVWVAYEIKNAPIIDEEDNLTQSED